LLIGIGVSASLQSSTCMLLRNKQAKGVGATETEIAEADPGAILMKMVTVNDAAADATGWLRSEKK
jgi:alkylhydroperoxidase/carboxymuconolactone decarboxylase family protein YurZ